MINYAEILIANATGISVLFILLLFRFRSREQKQLADHLYDLMVAITFGNNDFRMITMLGIMLYSASFMMSWGPICWVLIAEIFPNTIRGKAVAIAVAFQWIFNWIVSSTFVPMFNMHLVEGDHFGHWFTYGLYGAICILAALFVWRMVPETKGKTLEDMSRLWRK